MASQLFHQCGHNCSWSIDAFVQDETGDGLIVSPVHYPMKSVVSLSSKIKRRSLFDPQYFLPNSQKTKLNTYPFFPEKLLGGFSTANFPQFAQESANRCVGFQVEQDFQAIVIPARYFSQMFPDYTQRQEAYRVVPFLNAISHLRKKRPVMLTLPLTSHMVEHGAYRTDILNWVTSFPEIDGVYVIVEYERQSKQIRSTDFLRAFLQFIDDLGGADLKVLAGYLNTEALLVTAAGDYDVTFGTFENTRIFSIDKFLTTEEERRGPRPRIYLPGLLNWVQFDQAKQIQRALPSIWRDIYVPTDFAERALRAAVEPHFNQPELYRHFLLCFDEQHQALADVPIPQRRRMLLEKVDSAIGHYREILRAGISLETHGNGEHLPAWRTVLAGL